MSTRARRSWMKEGGIIVDALPGIRVSAGADDAYDLVLRPRDFETWRRVFGPMACLQALQPALDLWPGPSPGERSANALPTFGLVRARLQGIAAIFARP
jgi:hypothetical protein